MKLFAAGEKKHRAHRHRHPDPRRQRQRDRAEQKGERVEDRHDQADIDIVFLVIFGEMFGEVLGDMSAIIDQKPRAQHKKAAGERDEMNRIEQIKYAAGKREHRKGTNAAGTAFVGMGKVVFKSEAEKETQAEKERYAGGRWSGDHGGATG